MALLLDIMAFNFWIMEYLLLLLSLSLTNDIVASNVSISKVWSVHWFIDAMGDDWSSSIVK